MEYCEVKDINTFNSIQEKLETEDTSIIFNNEILFENCQLKAITEITEINVEVLCFNIGNFMIQPL